MVFGQTLIGQHVFLRALGQNVSEGPVSCLTTEITEGAGPENQIFALEVPPS
jgi:hypothetical protein